MNKSTVAQEADIDATTLAITLGVPAVDLDLLKCLNESSPVTARALAEATGYSRVGLIGHLDKLQRLGMIESHRVPGVAGTPAKAYTLIKAGVEAAAWSLYDAITAAIATTHNDR